MSVWTNEDLDFLKKNFNNYTKKELADKLGKTPNAVQIKANRLGLKREEKYHYDKRFFKDIDTEDKAYWLGFIYADGYVSKAKENRGYVVGIELKDADYKHLEKFNISIHGNVPVSHRKRSAKYIDGVYTPESMSCNIRLFCKDMFNDLIKHGCCQNKSLIKRRPNEIPDEFMKDFLRGYFDGNGSIAYSLNKKVNKSYLKIGITTGSKEYVDWLSGFLNDNGYGNIVMQDTNGSYRLQILSNSNIDFLKYLYDDSSIYLQRKYDKYINAVYGECNVINHK